jgi:hypothetical protein
MEDKKMKQPRSAATTLGLSVFLLAITFTCQILVFQRNWTEIGLSILIGTCATLAGGFAGLLASPYGTKDEERLSKVRATILALLTGYVLAKIDPLVTGVMKSEVILQSKNGANILIGLIGLLGGFITTYEFRAYKLGFQEQAVKQPDPATTPPQ